MTDFREPIPGAPYQGDPDFPYAPAEWTRDVTRAVAQAENLALADDHWAVVRSLQEFFARHEPGAVALRELSDALDEKFHHKGGMKYLFTLFPGGPIAQGCRLAGLKPPGGAVDLSFGSVA